MQKLKIKLILPIIIVITIISVQTVGATDQALLAGGMPFGIKLYTDGVLVAGISEVETKNGIKTPAQDAGLKIGDIITAVDGEKIEKSEEFASKLEGDGKTVKITFIRKGEKNKTEITPVLSEKDGKYKTGMWLRDSMAGIGTVTYIDPVSGEFGGLGHGVCDTESGELIPLIKGNVMGVKISGVKIGAVGDPGELKGYFTSAELGTIGKNSGCGVFGRLTSYPEGCDKEEKFPLGDKKSVHTGKAYIRSTVDKNGMAEYEIEIVRLPASGGSNFEICVTDEELISKTGGIVQGMSGSPILQDGKLVGAVTHVLISDPTKGYGIFIEDMMKAAG